MTNLLLSPSPLSGSLLRLAVKDLFSVGHVGDSRVYLIREGAIPLVLDCLFDCERAFFFLAARCLLTAALARAIVVRPKLIFFRAMPTICHKPVNLRNHREIEAQNAPPER
jgi:hypothetical protein